MAQETIITLPDMEHTIIQPMNPSMFLQQEHSMFVQQQHSIFTQQEDSMFVQQEHSAMVPVQEGLDIRNITDSITEKKTRRAKHLSSEKMIGDQNAAEGSNAKKLDHNAKERIRRMRINASFLALRGLLPDSRKSKKGRSAPAIVDRVLKYIPEMETEIEKLKQVRDDMQSASNNKQCGGQDPHSQLQGPTVSVTEVKNGEAVIQICTRKDHGGFSNLLQNIEAQGISIRSASTLCICDDAVCYQLHIEVNGSSHEYVPNIVSELKDKVLSWLS